MIANAVAKVTSDLTADFKKQLREATAENKHGRHGDEYVPGWDCRDAQLQLQLRELRETVQRDRETNAAEHLRTRTCVEKALSKELSDLDGFVTDSLQATQDTENARAAALALKIASVEDRCAAMDSEMADHLRDCSRQLTAMQNAAEERFAVALNKHTTVVDDKLAAMNDRIDEIKAAIADLRDQVADLADEEADCSALLDAASVATQASEGSNGEHAAGEKPDKSNLDGLKPLEKLAAEVQALTASVASCQTSLRFQSNFADHSHIKFIALILLILGGPLPDLDAWRPGCIAAWRKNRTDNLKDCLEELAEQSGSKMIRDRVDHYLSSIEAVPSAPTVPTESRIGSTTDSWPDEDDDDVLLAEPFGEKE